MIWSRQSGSRDDGNSLTGQTGRHDDVSLGSDDDRSRLPSSSGSVLHVYLTMFLRSKFKSPKHAQNMLVQSGESSMRPASCSNGAISARWAHVPNPSLCVERSRNGRPPPEFRLTRRTARLCRCNMCLSYVFLQMHPRPAKAAAKQPQLSPTTCQNRSKRTASPPSERLQFWKKSRN